MTIELDPWAGTRERLPGDFKRDARGTPYVSHPDGATVKTGERAGQIKWARYGRPSGFGKQIENQYNLIRWKERALVYGCTDNDVAQLGAELAAIEPWSEDWKSKADGVVAAAYRAAKTLEAAERGTHMHAVTEDDDTDRDWVHRAEAGEIVGIPLEVQAAMLAAWQQMLATFGLEILAVEVPVVNDRWRQAGTLDRIARLTRDLTFVTGDGELITIPAGTVIVLDLKTGKITTDNNGIVQWWHSYAIQIVAYADALPYDTTTETRGEWGWPIDGDWALIAHLPVADALEGTATCTLILVDLNAGREGAELCMMAAAWERRDDLFSFAHDAPAIEVPVQPKRELPDPHHHRAIVAERNTPTDDGTVGDEALKLITYRVDHLAPRARALMENYAREAHQAGRSFSIRKEPSQRRHLIYRALLTLGEYFGGDLEDDMVRAAVAVVIPDAGQLSVPVGATIGSLTHIEATQLLDVAMAVTIDDPALLYSEDGSPRWDVSVPAVTVA